jgi:hypothetical protein
MVNETSPVPDGMRLGREEDGALVLNFPIARDRFLSLFLPLFGLAFVVVGIMVLRKDGDGVGGIPLGIGLLLSGFGAYLARGRLELRLGADRLEWTRLFLRRWKTHTLERSAIASLGTQVGVRTNGQPTSWRLHFVLAEAAGEAAGKRPRRQLLPGFHSETAVMWLGGVLEKWAQAPFERTLDRSRSSD